MPNAGGHALQEMLGIAVCAILCIGQDWVEARGGLWTDMELFGHAKQELPRPCLKLGNSIPKHGSFTRILAMQNSKCSRSGCWY